VDKLLDIWLVSEYFYPTLAGAAERFRRYAPGLEKRGIHVNVLTIKNGSAPDYEEIEGISIQRVIVGNSKVPSAALLSKSIHLFRKTGQWPKVLQILSHTINGVSNVWWARFHRVPALTSVTTMPIGVGSEKIRLKTIIHQWIRYSPFNLVIASSGIMARVLMKQGIHKNRIKVIPNGVNIYKFRPIETVERKRELRKSLGIDVDDEIILFVGFISEKKGVDILTDAWPEIISKRPKAKILFVGPQKDKPYQNIITAEDKPSFYEHIIGKLSSYPSPQRMIFLGEVNNVEDFMRAADVFVLPSKMEGMPNVVAEAMATGLPCIVSPNIGVLTEFGVPGREFLISQNNSESLSKAIVDLISNKKRLFEIGSSARLWVENHLDLDLVLDQYAETYQALSSWAR